MCEQYYAMSQKLLDCIEINTADHCEYTVIWLHGLGASGHDFEPIVPELQLLQRPGVRFLFPHAPVRPISINGGAAMRGWYDIDSLDFGSRKQDVDGIKESATQINDLIDNEIARGVPASRVTLAGFSQGGAVALYAGLTGQHVLGGIMALSTYMPIQEVAIPLISEDKKSVPIFMSHGEYDDVIHIKHAQQSLDSLKQQGLSVEWHSYPIAHSVSADEVIAIANWLKRQFGM
jgi:phospholipase/carboxylesterase